MSKNRNRLTRGAIIRVENGTSLDELGELIAIDPRKLALYQDIVEAIRNMADGGRRDTVAKIFHVDWIYMKELLDLLAQLDNGEFGQHS